MTQVPPLLRHAVYDGWDFGFRLSYLEGSSYAPVMRRPDIRGWYISAQGHPCRGYWRVPHQVVDERLDVLFSALEAIAGERCQLDLATARQMIGAARSQPDPRLFSKDLQIRLYPMGVEAVAIAGSYHPGVVALAKSMGGRFLPLIPAWHLPRATPAAVRHNLCQALRLEEHQVEIFAGEYSVVDGAFVGIRGNDIRLQVAGPPPEGGTGAPRAGDDGENQIYLAITSAQTATTVDVDTLKQRLGRYDLLEYQREGVLHLVRQNSSLLADDMGLGKSRQAAVAADMVAAEGEQILVACPASLILNWEREIHTIAPAATIARQCYHRNARWIVTNYERLDQLVKHAGNCTVMITDEAHELKEPHTQRTRVAFDVAAQIPHRYLLSGTPILNRECEIHTLLRLSGHTIGNMPLGEFEKQFAGDAAFRVALNQRLSEWMLRRSKDMVLKHLKGKRRQVQVMQGDDAFRDGYNAALRDPATSGLEKISRLRSVLEEAKIDTIVELVGALQGDDKVIIFTEFRKTIALLKSRLDALGWKSVTLTGSDLTTKRQKAVDTFQQDPETRVFIGTTRAAGVGITLTAANYVMFASLPWTPALLEQAEDRAYRLGQQRLVIVKIPLVEDSIDGMLWELLKHKKQVATEIISPADVAKELAAMDLF
ncbi:DEAD/DEAH box helicase [Chitinimonas koreensis]|uniref:DEAD/DEAH box helicase n=1 Tax=Chitinimonas koreensis TaxID=356302 RepID=UPI0004900164|nr:DEAD/DEAH box helicase [Chitinimonas koreensis]QNM95483.1 DEAD/DEAH box helicase [Chitinimonas koreensis]